MNNPLPSLRINPSRRTRRRRLPFAVLLAATLAGGAIVGYREYSSAPQIAPATGAPIEVYFSPNGGCTAAIISAIDKAERKICVQAYYFTSAPIAEALVRAHRRGVAVTTVLDQSQTSSKGYSSALFLHRAGVPTFIDNQHAIAHNKIILVDDELVITGSFNFTRAAESSNAENVLFIRDKATMQKYLDNWNLHLGHSTRYTPPAATETR